MPTRTLRQGQSLSAFMNAHNRTPFHGIWALHGTQQWRHQKANREMLKWPWHELQQNCPGVHQHVWRVPEYLRWRNSNANEILCGLLCLREGSGWKDHLCSGYESDCGQRHRLFRLVLCRQRWVYGSRFRWCWRQPTGCCAAAAAVACTRLSPWEMAHAWWL